MKIIELADSKRLIPSEHFNVCLIDGLKKEQIHKQYSPQEVVNKSNCYYIQKFIYHLKNVHNIELIPYCEKYLNIDWPKCPTKGSKVGYKIYGNGILLSRFSRGGINKSVSPAFVAGCEKLSRDRMGENNPMFGATPWNRGLGLEHPIIRANAEKKRGTKMSDASRAKMRQRRADHPLKVRHSTPHSPETVEKLRLNTAKLWASGAFNRVTSIHLKVREFLKTLNLIEPFQEEYQVKYFSMDFAFPIAKVAIEAQGTYFHIDPRIYPNGPTNAMQRRNFGRDKAKQKVCCDQQGWKIIEVWETEINDESFKEYLLCKLKELNLLKI